MENNKKYLAFISYKREDEKWARWLQYKLEHYHIPAEVRKANSNLPANIRPIFKDTTDLSGGVLEKAINEALDQSRYLIVICSPRAAKSIWVCKEVEKFIELGKEEYIIPFIVDGTPFSDDASECFPAALKKLSGERELLGINVNENGQDSAAVKVVARMFNLGFDVLWRRYQRDQKRRVRRIAIGIVSFISFLVGVIIVIWSSNVKLERQNDIIARQNSQLQNDSILMAQHLNRIRKDSILLSHQKDSILQQKQSLSAANETLIRINHKLIKETNAALRNQSIAVAHQAIQYTDNGDSYLGRLLALEILPKDLSAEDRPLTLEAEFALRQSNLSDNSHLIGHTREVNCIDVTSDDKFIASGADDNKVIIWDKNNANKLVELKAHNDKIVSVKYGGNDKYLLTASLDGTIIIWDTRDYSIKYKYTDGHSFEMSKAIFGPKSDIISGDWGGNIVVRDIATGAISHRFKAHDRGPLGVALSNDGKYLVSYSSAQDYPLKIWNTDRYEVIKQFPLKEHCSVYNAAFSPDNKILMAILGAGKMKLYSTANWQETLERDLADIGLMYEAACFSHDNKTIALGSRHGREIKLLSSETLDCIGSYRCNGKVNSCLFSHDGRFLLACDDSKKIYSWDLDPSLPYECVLEVTGVKKISSLGDRFLVLSKDNCITGYKGDSNNGFKTVLSEKISGDVFDIHCLKGKSYYSIVNNFLVDSNNNIITDPLPGMSVFARKKSRVSIYDLTTRGRLFEKWFDSEVHIIAVSDDATLIAVSDTRGKISLHSIKSGKTIDEFVNPNGALNTLSFNFDSSLLLTSDLRGLTCMYGLHTKTKHVFNEHTNSSYSVFGKKNIFSTYSADGSIILWNSLTGKKISSNIQNLGWHSIKSLNFFGDDNRIIATYNDKIGIWDVSTGLPIEIFDYPNTDYVAISGNATDLAILADGTLKLYKYPGLQTLINKNTLKMKGRKLTPAERTHYLIESL